MYKSVLPVFILFVVFFSCGSPQSSDSTSDADTTAAGGVSSDTTQEDGDPDGDIFRTDALEDAISGESILPDTVSEYGTAEQEEHDEMIAPHEILAEVCGFSPDGKYFAFMQIDRGDGYQDVKANVYVIDVEKNEWATSPASLTGDREDEQLDANIQKMRDKLLKQYGITTQQNMGHEFGYIGNNPNNVVLIDEKRYVLDFKSDNGMIELRVKGQGKDILLQKDSKLPASRGPVRRIRLNKAYVLGDRIAVLVEYDGDIETGFENYRYYARKNIVVTGVVK